MVILISIFAQQHANLSSPIHTHLFPSVPYRSYNYRYFLKDAGLQTCLPNVAAIGLGAILQYQTKSQSPSVQRRKSASSSWFPLIDSCLCTWLCRHLRKGVCSCQDVPLLAQGTAALPLQPALSGQDCVVAQIPSSLYTGFFLQKGNNLPHRTTLGTAGHPVNV